MHQQTTNVKKTNKYKPKTKLSNQQKASALVQCSAERQAGVDEAELV